MSVSNEVSRPYTTGEVAALLHISERSVRRLGDRGRLTPVQTGLRLRRWRREDVHRMLQGDAAPARS